MRNDARFSVGFPQHPKTKKLYRRLGAEGVWRFVCLILWAATNRSDGNLSGMSTEDVELAVDWSGDHGALVSTLLELGFVDGVEGDLRMHDWKTHQPWNVGFKDRSAKARWSAIKRHHGEAYADLQVPEHAAVRAVQKQAKETKP